MITAIFAAEDDRRLQSLRRAHYPPEFNKVPAHITLFRQLPPSVAMEIDGRLKTAVARPAPAARIAGVMDLGEGTALRVDSPELVAIREELAWQLQGLLIPQDMGPWRPHVTIQNKVRAKEARALQQQLAAAFEPRPLSIAGLASWHFLSGPWAPVKTYRFRG